MQAIVRNAKWAGLSVLLLSGAAHAAFVPVLSGTSPSGANTTFNYNLNFGTGGAVERLQSGDFITIYDIPGFVSATAPPGFSVSSPNTGTTPTGTLPLDNPAVPNVVFTYTGTTLTTNTTFPNALITSTFDGSALGTFTSRDTSNQPPAGLPVAQIGPVTIPGGGLVPEPSSVLSLGAFGVLTMRRRK